MVPLGTKMVPILIVFHDLVMYVCSKKGDQLITKLYQKHLIQLRMQDVFDYFPGVPHVLHGHFTHVNSTHDEF